MRRDERVAGDRPQAQVAHGQTGCMVSLNDMADRAPRVLPTARPSTSAAASVCATSTRRTSPMAGMPA